ncbi:PREDICTED: protein UPSTREAM OF FLC-like [Tarenaya hassleriana]|uniref:protein UPSTREAM OF FLC-like n=1 Tax=Tarenaya hassleriana TaxID=28532 RepID=UPI00053C3A60|nr:PREDICTED: protein UPSTREAM OF FLC-like [Tarenaya hassleriana]
MIKIMSENPRFGNSQAEEKEHFSGSIVETVSKERVTAEPVLRKSNSFNEERNKSIGTSDEGSEEKMNVKGKCMPRIKSSCSISYSTQIKN